MENKDLSQNKAASQELRARLVHCGALSAAVAAAFQAQQSWKARNSVVRMMAGLVRASAAAALAMRQVDGIETNHTVVIQRRAGREGDPLQVQKRIGRRGGGSPTVLKTNGAPP